MPSSDACLASSVALSFTIDASRGNRAEGVLGDTLRGVVHQQAGSLDLGRQVGDAVRERLKRTHRFAELLALLDICQRVIERALGITEEHRR